MKKIGVLLVVLLLIVGSMGISSILGVDFWYIPYGLYAKTLSQTQWNIEGRILTKKLKFIDAAYIRLGGQAFEEKAESTTELSRFLKLCENVGATPIVQIPLNKYSLSYAISFVSEVKKLWNGNLSHIIFAIGNEPDIYTDVGLKPMNVKQYLDKYEEFVDTLEEEYQGIRIVGPDYSWKWRFGWTGNWIKPFYKSGIWEKLYALTIHRYPFNKPKSIAQVIKDTSIFTSEISSFQSHFPTMKVGIDEANLTWNWKLRGKFSGQSYLAALWYASLYGRSLAMRLWNFSAWSLVNGHLSMITITSKGKVDLHPTYYAFAIYRNFGKLSKYYVSPSLDIFEGLNFNIQRVIIVNKKAENVKVNLKKYIGLPVVVNVPSFSFGRIIVQEKKVLLNQFFTRKSFQDHKQPKVMSFQQ